MGKRIIFVGLPLFAKRLAKAMSEYDSANKYIAMDTYYSKWDKIKAVFLIPFSKTVYSINGSVQSSFVFDYALKWKKKLYMNWVGTDVLKSLKAFRSNDFKQDYIEKAKHHCEVDWIQEELAEMKINAELCNFAFFEDSKVAEWNTQGPLKILGYIPDNRAAFYGQENFIKLAHELPEVEFHLVGGLAENIADKPKNLIAHGWVSDMSNLFDQIHVCYRFTEHDGLSNTVLEGLALGKYIVYNNNFPHCEVCVDYKALKLSILELLSKFVSKELRKNELGMLFISKEFSREKILGNLKRILIDE